MTLSPLLPYLPPAAGAPDPAWPRDEASPSLDAQKIKELSRQFEALLLRQILQETRKSVIQSGLFEESSSADIYHDMVNFHLADAISQSGSLGLAEQLERELTRQHAAPPPTGADSEVAHE